MTATAASIGAAGISQVNTAADISIKAIDDSIETANNSTADNIRAANIQ